MIKAFMDTVEDIILESLIGKKVKCPDGLTRILRKVEPKLLYYDIFISNGVSSRTMEVSPTYRSQVEDEFLEGIIID